MPTIEWKDIKGYEGLYQINSDGQVRSLNRVIMRNDKPWNFKGKILSERRDSSGYAHVTFSKGKSFKVHRLLYETFIGKLIPGMDIDHIDNNSYNNNLNNLQQITRRENCSKDNFRRNCTSSYVGVKRHKDKWRANIQLDGKNIHIGIFKMEIDAHMAYLDIRDNPDSALKYRKYVSNN